MYEFAYNYIVLLSPTWWFSLLLIYLQQLIIVQLNYFSSLISYRLVWDIIAKHPFVLLPCQLQINSKSLKVCKPHAMGMCIAGFHLSITDIDGSSNSQELLKNCEAYLSAKLLTLSLRGASVQEHTLVNILQNCVSLTTLDLSCCNSLFHGVGEWSCSYLSTYTLFILLISGCSTTGWPSKPGWWNLPHIASKPPWEAKAHKQGF